MSHPSVALKVSVMYLHIPSALAVGSLIHVASVYTLIFIINMLLILCNVSCCHVYPTIYTPLLHLSSFPSSSFHPFLLSFEMSLLLLPLLVYLATMQVIRFSLSFHFHFTIPHLYFLLQNLI
jgi:hypothetical protein